MHVDGVAESVLFAQMRRALLQRAPQRRPEVGMLRDPGRFKDQEFAAVHALSYGLHVVRQRVGKAGLMQPHAHPGVPVLHQDDRAQAGLLQAGREQHRQVQTRCDPCVHDAIRRANLLAVHAERRGRLSVMQRLGGQRAVDGGHLLPHDVAAFGLVAVHLQFGVLRAQQLGRLANQPIHSRIIRHGKRGQQFRQGARAGPLVIGQHGNRLRSPADFLRA
ncbi:Uncharacterised protein [Achromobacter denitrificans]|nr:Uncharacterised protein [Achromobacter denitrificans]